MTSETDAVGYVYFVQATRCRLIKIGYSDEPLVRLRSLRMSGPDELTLLAVKRGDMADERELHATFARFRLHGEWFKPSKRLLRFIEEVRAQHDQTIAPRPVRPVLPMQAAPPVKPQSLDRRYKRPPLTTDLPEIIDVFTGRPLQVSSR